MKTALIAAIASILVLLAALNVPSQFLTFQSIRLGNVSPTTITTATNLANFPAIYNANLTLLDNGKIDTGTTSVNSITTLNNLSLPVGQLTGTLAVANGGTASTTISSNQVIIGNGSSGFKTVNGFGTSGMFLTSSGAGAAPTWTSGLVDTTQNYSWTGIHAFSNAASTTVAKGLYADFIAARAFNATSTNATSTFTGVFMVNATTTNFEIGGICTNCINHYERITNTGAGPTGAGNTGTVTATCSTGKTVIGGGASNTVGDKITLRDSYPASDSTWTVVYMCHSTTGGCGANTMTAYAICAYR